MRSALSRATTSRFVVGSSSSRGMAGIADSDPATTKRALLDIEEAHTAACDAGVSTYTDPATGYKVFTSASHEKRGFCCGNACRYVNRIKSFTAYDRTLFLGVQVYTVNSVPGTDLLHHMNETVLPTNMSSQRPTAAGLVG